jgi:hypothetical protein
MKLMRGFELLAVSCEIQDNARRDIAMFEPVKDLIDTYVLSPRLAVDYFEAATRVRG